MNAAGGGVGRAFAGYRRVLGISQVPSTVFTGLIGRLPAGMLGLAIVLLIRQQTGSYAAATAPGRAAISLGMLLTTMAAVPWSPAMPPLIVMSIGGVPSM